SCHPTCPRHLPACFRDMLPEPPVPVATDPPAAQIIPCVILHVFDSFCSAFNVFSIAQEYRHHPSYNPNSFLSPKEMSNASSHMTVDSHAETIPMPPPWPFQTMSVWRLMRWILSPHSFIQLYTGSKQKSEAEVSRLVSMVITADDFWPDDLQNFNAHMELKQFDA
ncbi:hypothetical protein PISMIDRAFT_36034, partial [Pisolithus microcarpus 441]